MANLQLANKWHLFSYGFAEENQEKIAKNSRNHSKNLSDFGKKLKDLKKKLKGMRPSWAYWASKKCTKNKPGLICKTSGIVVVLQSVSFLLLREQVETKHICTDNIGRYR